MLRINIAIFILCIFTALSSCGPSGKFLGFKVKPSACEQLYEEMEIHGTIKGFARTDRDSTEIEIRRATIERLNEKERTVMLSYLQSYIPTFGFKEQYVFVSYYPGKDGCNSTGWATRDEIGLGNKLLTEAIEKEGNIAELNICTESSGLHRWNKNRTYRYDKDNYFINQFFTVRTPCVSHLIIHSSGVYYQYNGPSRTEKEISDLQNFKYCVETEKYER